MHARRAALQQAIGEAAGGGAHIQADASRDTDAEVRDRGIQLEPAAADERRLRQHFDAASASTGWPGFRGFAAIHQHLARHDQRLRFFARGGQTALHQQTVQARLHDLRWTIRSASSCRRPARAPKAASVSCARRHSIAGHAPRFLDAVDRRERDLVLLRVFARRLAQRFGGFLHVQDVVHDLKCQADVLAVAGERLVLRVARRPRRWRPGAGWRAAGRRSWRGGWIRAAARWAACPSPSRSATCPAIMPPTVPAAVASSAIMRGFAVGRDSIHARPGLRRPGSAANRPPEWPWRRRRLCAR